MAGPLNGPDRPSRPGEHDPLVALLRRTFEADVAEADAHAARRPADLEQRREVARRRSTVRPWLAVAAATVAVAGAASLLAVRRADPQPGRGDSTPVSLPMSPAPPVTTAPTSTQPPSSTSTQPPSSTQPPTTTAPATTAPEPPGGAEVATVEWFLPTVVPSGFELVDLAAVDGPDGEVSVTLLPDGRGDASGGLRIRSQAAGGSLDDLADPAATRHTVGAIEYAVSGGVSAVDGLPYGTVRWIDGSRQYELSGALDDQSALDVAVGVTAVDAATAAEAWSSITDTARSRPTVGAATLADGTAISARGARSGASGVVALCVDAPTPQCVTPPYERVLQGDAEPALFEVIAVDGVRRVVGWQPDEPPRPSVVPATGSAEPSDPDVLATIALEVVPAATGEGWFVSFVVPEGEPIPGVRADEASALTFFPVEYDRPAPRPR